VCRNRTLRLGTNWNDGAPIWRRRDPARKLSGRNNGAAVRWRGNSRAPVRRRGNGLNVCHLFACRYPARSVPTVFPARAKMGKSLLRRCGLIVAGRLTASDNLRLPLFRLLTQGINLGRESLGTVWVVGSDFGVLSRQGGHPAI